MPIYEYQCPKGHHFEEIQSFSAKSVASCPKCKLKAKRKISLAAFHLKGSGWYSKDSTASTKKKKEKESESPTNETAADSAKPAETSIAEKPVKKEKPSKEKKPKKDKSA